MLLQYQFATSSLVWYNFVSSVGRITSQFWNIWKLIAGMNSEILSLTLFGKPVWLGLSAMSWIVNSEKHERCVTCIECMCLSNVCYAATSPSLFSIFHHYSAFFIIIQHLSSLFSIFFFLCRCTRDNLMTVNAVQYVHLFHHLLGYCVCERNTLCHIQFESVTFFMLDWSLGQFSGH